MVRQRPVLTAVWCAAVWLAAGSPGAAASAPEQRIVFLHYWTGALSGGIDEMVETFRRGNPEIRVRATGFEHESFKVGIRVMLAAGNPPDLFSYWAGARVQSVVDAGHLAPIDDVWRAERLEERFSPLVAAACTYDGHKYIVPVTQHYVGFFYNRKLFQSLGLHPPRTWGEFEAACEALRGAGVAPIALGSREHWPAQFWFDYLLLRTAGPSYRDRLVAGRAAYTDPEVRSVFARWAGLLERGYFHPSPHLYDWSEAAKLVYHGQAAMTLMGTWIIGLYDRQLDWPQGEGYDFFPFPTLDPEVPRVSVGPIDAIALPREGNVAAARKALAYFAEVEPQQRMSRGSGALAPNLRVPASFYTELQQRVLREIQASDRWAFAYDLATPPPVAQAGLEAFSAFLAAPGRRDEVLSALEAAAREHRDGR